MLRRGFNGQATSHHANREAPKCTAGNKHQRHKVVNSSTHQALRADLDQVFSCPEESGFYANCLHKLFLHPSFRNHPDQTNACIEFGSGDGTPVLQALQQAGPHADSVFIKGFELSARAAARAERGCQELELMDKYNVSSTCFFQGLSNFGPSKPTWLFANPPYLPSPDADILMPHLHGGMDGSDLTCQLLDLQIPGCLLLLASIANPCRILRHAHALGYRVVDFSFCYLPFGTYSSEPKVMQQIRYLEAHGKAFTLRDHETNTLRDHMEPSSSGYVLAGVAFQKGFDKGGVQEDMREQLQNILTTLV